MREVFEVSDIESGEVVNDGRHRGRRKLDRGSRTKRREMASIGRSASMARRMFADLGIAIGEMSDKVAESYVDEFLGISSIYETLTDADDITGAKLKNKIAALMIRIEENQDYFFRWKFTTFRVANKIIYKVVSTERTVVI